MNAGVKEMFEDLQIGRLEKRITEAAFLIENRLSWLMLMLQKRIWLNTNLNLLDIQKSFS